MEKGNFVLVNCKIRRGAFSGERVFQLPMARNKGEYIGIAPVGHCLDESQNPLGRDNPKGTSEIDGFIEAYLIANGGDDARIELPDGEAIYVPVGIVPYRVVSDRGTKYVPVGS